MISTEPIVSAGLHSMHQSHIDLVILCPAAVFGPLRYVAGRSINDLNISNAMFWKMFCCAGKDGKLPKQTIEYGHMSMSGYVIIILFSCS